MHFFLLSVAVEPTITLSAAQSLAALIGFFLLWGGAYLRMVKTNATKEAALYAAIQKNSEDINEVGARVNKVTTNCAQHDEALTTIRIEQQASRDDRGNMRESIGRNSAAIAALREELQEERMAVLTTLHNSEKAAAERDALLRERLGRIDERLDIERMVSSVVKALNNRGD